ncbi:MAG: prolipoprotein diacylglyceryl transferase [Hyphomonadaceae bacterium]
MISVATDPGYHRVFDAVAWVIGLGAGWAVSRWRLQDARAALPRGHGFIVSIALGAVAGAYLAGSLPSIVSGAGSISHSVVGALAGAIIGVEIYKAARGIRRSTGAVFVAPFTIGITIGRWGCFFAGLPDGTYGLPTRLPWGVDLGDGIARHPVQLYESASMLLFLGAYLVGLGLRAPWAVMRGFYFMVLWYAGQRFVWEFFKPYPSVLGPFNLFHLISVGLTIYGCIWLARSRQGSVGLT